MANQGAWWNNQKSFLDSGFLSFGTSQPDTTVSDPGGPEQPAGTPEWHVFSQDPIQPTFQISDTPETAPQQETPTQPIVASLSAPAPLGLGTAPAASDTSTFLVTQGDPGLSASADTGSGSGDDAATSLFELNGGFVESDTSFTPLALSSLADAGAAGINQIYYTTTGGDGSTPTARRVAQIGVNGTIQTGGSVTLRDASQVATWNSVIAVTADPAANKYFIVDSAANLGSRILWGNILSPGSLTQIQSFAADTLRTFDITIDQPNRTLWYTVAPTSATSNAASIGIWKINEDGTGATQVIGGYAASTAANLPKSLALDLANNLVWFTEGAALNGTSRLLFGNVVSGAKSAALISHNAGTLISDVVVNNGTVYYSTINGGTVSGNNIFAVPYTVTGSGASAAATLGTVSTLYAGANAGNPLSLAVDPATGRLYTSGASTVGVGVPSAAINVGTISGGGSLQQVFTQSNGTIGVSGAGLFFETVPTVTATGTVTHVLGGAAVTLAPGATVSNPSGFTLKSATVAITGGNFLNDGDTLTAVTTGTSISAVFSGDVLTLTGVDTAAKFQQVLNSVAYRSTAIDPTNGGANATRTVTWTVNDGVIPSASPTTTIDIHGLPTVVAGGNASFQGGGSPVTLDAGLTLSNPFSATLASATVSIGGFLSGDVLNFINQGGIVGNYAAGTGTLSLTGIAGIATYQAALRSITYGFDPGNGDPTGGGVNTSRVISWVVHDGVTTSTAVTSDLDTIHVAPTITTSGTVTFGIGQPDPALDPTLTVVAPNSFGLLHGATVTITGGAFVGEDDILSATTIGTSISFVYDPTLNIGTLTGADTVANYQGVLRSVTISSGSLDPTNGGANPTRTLSWVVNDGVASSAPSTSFADAVVCFAAGTGIATPGGVVPVEHLRPGDLVLTRSGDARPVEWMGHRAIDLVRHGQARHLRPVRILADAFAPGVPARDLRLSPAHAVLVGEVLVPVELLINHATIIQETDCRAVTYFHVELPTHDVLLAEGLAAETYLDTGNRAFFANGGGAIQLHPDPRAGGRAVASCAPFVDAAALVEPEWRRLAERAVLLGRGVAAPPQTTRDPDLCVMVGSRCLRPASRRHDRYVFVLPATDQPAVLVSRSAIPSDTRPWLGDHRRLGVMVAGMTLRGTDGTVCRIPLDHPDLGAGWWAPEWHAPAVLRRWTDGRAAVPTGGLAAMLEVEIGATADYDIDAPPRRRAA